jgi:hypothetical protein
MPNAPSVCRILEADYGIVGRAGTKVQCPFCQHHHFFIKRDDSIGKCFHPSCGRFISAYQDENPLKRGFFGVLDKLFHEFHRALLDLPQHPYPKDAYQYLVNERRIHPQVVADSLLGIVPSGYVELLDTTWQPLIDQAATDPNAAQTNDTRDQPKQAMWTTDFLTTAKEKLRSCLLKRAGWLCFFYTDAYHRIVAIRFRQPYSHTFVFWKVFDSITGLFGQELFAPIQDKAHEYLNDFLIATEGEVNSLQLQSALVRQAQAKGKPVWSYLRACSVGGVQNADFETMRQVG